MLGYVEGVQRKEVRQGILPVLSIKICLALIWGMITKNILPVRMHLKLVVRITLLISSVNWLIY
jgi:hypothetical protein